MAIFSRKKADLAKVLERSPLSPKGKRAVRSHREEIQKILAGEDDRTLVIVGPCSAWPGEAVVEYAKQLKRLEGEVSDKIKIVMRVYSQKPRTTVGWLGAVAQPDPFVPPNIQKGVEYVRKLALAVNDIGLPVADELLFTHKVRWIGDLLSWVAVGARSAEDQEHRVFASGLDLPVGMKNPTSGDIAVGVNSVVAAQHGHVYYEDGYQIETGGNPYSHLVLRGGSSGPNYRMKHLQKAQALMEKAGVKNASVIVDASHDNSRVRGGKEPRRQEAVVRDVLASCEKDASVRKVVKGFLLESFLKEGKQDLGKCTRETVDTSGLSVTDPCMSFEQTEKVIREIYRRCKPKIGSDPFFG